MIVLQRGEKLFVYGDQNRNRSAYLILQGQISLLVPDISKQNLKLHELSINEMQILDILEENIGFKLIQNLQPGKLFGELAAIDDQPR